MNIPADPLGRLFPALGTLPRIPARWSHTLQGKRKARHQQRNLVRQQVMRWIENAAAPVLGFNLIPVPTNELFADYTYRLQDGRSIKFTSNSSEIACVQCVTTRQLHKQTPHLPRIDRCQFLCPPALTRRDVWRSILAPYPTFLYVRETLFPVRHLWIDPGMNDTQFAEMKKTLVQNLREWNIHPKGLLNHNLGFRAADPQILVLADVDCSPDASG